MKTFVLTILCILSIKSIYGIDFKEYNKYVNLAELAIVNNNPQKVEKYYRIAFGINSSPFGQDIQNALNNSINLKSKVLAFNYAEKLADLGVGPHYFLKKTSFAWLKEKKEWRNLIRRATIERKNIQTRHTRLLHNLAQMKEEYDWIVNRIFAQDITPDSIKILSQNKEAIESKLINIFLEKGYLSEYVIGLNIGHDTILEPPVFTPILQMKYMRSENREIIKFQNDTISMILTEAMRSGKVSADYIAQTISSKFADEIKLPPIYIVGCKLYEFKNHPSFYKKLDEYRALVGLSTYEQYLKKLRYQEERPFMPFRLVSNIPNYSYPSQWLVDNLKNLKIIASLTDCDSQ